ncbi:MAG: cytochrome c [Actinobacteria bacterium]|nr:cytochrome c [Actinomycetota bacterium]
MSARPRRLVAATLLAAVATFGGLAACGGSDENAVPEMTTEAAKAGQALAKDRGCLSCHTESGRRSTGPTWKGLAGSEVELASGETVTADDDYLKRAIVDPKAEVVAGFAPIMPTAYSDLTDDQLADLVAYLRALSPDAS